MAYINYIEFWATKHCNLNCKGCSSCSPISKEWYLDPKSIEKDLTRMKDLDFEIENINILGGEPLLHPNLVDIFAVVKNIYPKVNLGMLTNGILLPSMNKNFWDTCVKYNIKLNVTCFPIFSEEKILQIEALINEFNLPYHLTRKKKFNKILVLNNKSSMNEIQQACGCNHAYNLYDGYLSRCTVPMITQLFNEHFQCNLNTDGRFSIYEHTTKEIMEFLAVPNNSCKNCSSKPIKVLWEKAEQVPQITDWIIGDN